MKSQFVILNILLLGVLIPFIGGGAFAKLGFFFLVGSLLFSLLVFGKNAKEALFNSGTQYLYYFLIFFLLTSSFDALGAVAIFGRLSAPIFFALIVSIINKRPELQRIQRNFVIVWFIILCYYEVQSLNFIANNPMGLRELISTNKDDSIVVGGGFSLPYALAILVPGLFLYCKQRTFPRTYRIIGMGLCVYFAVLVFSALYMTAIILMIVGVGLAFVYGYSRPKQMLITSLIAAACISLYEFLPMLIEQFSPEGTNVLMKRFTEIDSILKGNDISDSQDFFSRIKLSLKSIDTFLENPILGIGWKSSYDFFELEKAGVGSHAQWFDIFATYGIFALLIILYLQKSASRIVRKNNITIVLFVILGFLNPCLQFTVVFATYCLIPMCRLLFIKTKA